MILNKPDYERNLNILHITNWYPNIDNPVEGIFIKEHIDALEQHCKNTVVHLQVKWTKDKLFRIQFKKITETFTICIAYSSLNIWLLKEIISSLLLLVILIKFNVNKKFDVLNVHIAYPNLTFLHLFLNLIKVPIIVTEHWSAYHYNFNLPFETEKLNRIKRIFFNKLKFITVSNALAADIIKFSRNVNLNYNVVPNVVRINLGFEKMNYSIRNNKNVFFCLAYWKEIKNPFVIFNAFNEMSKSYPDVILKVGGAGPLLPKMIEFINNLGLQSKVVFTGQLTKDQVYKEMESSTAFLHCSKYETFSVVCAEALCTGLPVISSNIPAIAEYINNSNGILVPNDDVHSWVNAIRTFILNYTSYNKFEIASNAYSKFSSDAVAEKYFAVLKESILQYRRNS